MEQKLESHSDGRLTDNKCLTGTSLIIHNNNIYNNIYNNNIYNNNIYNNINNIYNNNI